MFVYYTERSYMFRHRGDILREVVMLVLCTAATSQPLHIQPLPTTPAVFINFINFNQLLILNITFCKNYTCV